MEKTMFKIILLITFALILWSCDDGSYFRTTFFPPGADGEAPSSATPSPPVSSQEIINFDLPDDWERDPLNPTELSTLSGGQRVILFWSSSRLDDQTDLAARIQEDLLEAQKNCPELDSLTCPFLPYTTVVPGQPALLYAEIEPDPGAPTGLLSRVYFKNNLGFFSGLIITDDFQKHLPALQKIAGSMRRENWTGPNEDDLKKADQINSQLPPF